MIYEKVPHELLFTFEIECFRGPFNKNACTPWQLPSFEKKAKIDGSARVHMAWDMQGLSFRFQVPYEGTFRCVHPNIQEGDSIELFIDTRNVKTSRSTHRFFHHFFFLPERIDGIQCGEITKFRSLDTHPLAPQKEFGLAIITQDGQYVMDIHIPSHCLHGYHPEVGEQLGLCYTINRYQKRPYSWPFSEEQASLCYQPHLFPTITLQETL